MELKLIIDLSDRAVTAIDKLANALSVKNEGPWLNPTPTVTTSTSVEEKSDVKSVKVTTTSVKQAKPIKEDPVKEATEEDAEVDEATLRAKVAEGSAAGLKDKIKAYLKENFKTLKLADLDPSDYSKVYNAVNEMLAE